MKQTIRKPEPDTKAVARMFRAFPAGIWVLGCGSLFMDMSSELIHSLLPVYLVSVLGASMAEIGLIEGIAEATAAVSKIFSGALSDYLGRRKFLVVLGYGLAALTKPVFPLAASLHWVLAARFIDRLGKGIRGAPRDALVADLTPPELRGAAYGIRQALDSIGAFTGPLLAMVGMLLLAGNIRSVLWIAVVPAVAAVSLLAVAVHEPPAAAGGSPARRSFITVAAASRLSLTYWLVVVVGMVFSLARFSEAFLVLRAQSVGLTPDYVPLVIIIMNVVYACISYPAGLAADRFSSRLLLIAGLLTLIVADLVLTVATLPWQVFVGVLFWGVHLGLTQGLLSRLVANAAPVELRGTAFGIFNLVTGVALLLASVIAGMLWDHLGAQAPFLAGACFAALAVLGIMLYAESRPGKTKGESALP